MSSWKARIYVNSRALSSVPPDLNLFVLSIAQPALIDGRGFVGGNAVIAAQPAGQIHIRATFRTERAVLLMGGFGTDRAGFVHGADIVDGINGPILA